MFFFLGGRGEEAYFFQEKWMMIVSGVSDAEGEGGGIVTKSQTKRCSSKEDNLTKVTPAGGSILRKLKYIYFLNMLKFCFYF